MEAHTCQGQRNRSATTEAIECKAFTSQLLAEGNGVDIEPGLHSRQIEALRGDLPRFCHRTKQKAKAKLCPQKRTYTQIQLKPTYRAYYLVGAPFEGENIRDPDLNDLDQTWLNNRPELSGKCKTSPVFDCSKSAARSPTKKQGFEYCLISCSNEDLSRA